MSKDIIRNLRECLARGDLPADMRQGIERAIEFHTGKPEPRPVPPAPLGPGFTARVTINGETFDTSSQPKQRNPW
jgi:hypothetical protein